MGCSKKIVKNEFNLCCKRGDPMIYENSIFPAYVLEKNKIITPCGMVFKLLVHFFFILSLNRSINIDYDKMISEERAF